METIIKKAIEGGAFGNFEKIKDFSWHIGTGNECDLIFFDNGIDGIKMSLHKQFMRAEFWQSLGKSCGWEKIVGEDIKLYKQSFADILEHRILSSGWIVYALRFHEINLTEGWESAVKWLSNLIEE